MIQPGTPTYYPMYYDPILQKVIQDQTSAPMVMTTPFMSFTVTLPHIRLDTSVIHHVIIVPHRSFIMLIYLAASGSFNEMARYLRGREHEVW